MNSKSYIVMGEAPESESEEEIDSSGGVQAIREQIKKGKGRVIVGEANESDDDDDTMGDTGSLESASSALSVSSLPSLTSEKKYSRPHSRKTQTLLIKKLYEQNVSLHKNLPEFINRTILNAGQELNAANQQLVKCQIQLQEASVLQRGISARLDELEFGMNSVRTEEFIPDIDI